MKTLSVFLAALIGISCFGQVFQAKKYVQYYKAWEKNKTQENYDKMIKYRQQAQFGTKEYDNCVKLAYVITDSKKTYNNISEILADMDKTCKINDKKCRIKALGSIVSVSNNTKIQKEFADNDEYMKYTFIACNNRICLQLSYYYIKEKDYANAVKYAEKARTFNDLIAQRLIRAYTLNGQKDKAFEVGFRLLLENRVSDPKKAMTILTKMMQIIPDNYPDEKLADFLLKVGKRYPAPGADFEAWKGFMGFVGYRYKQITGKDLFSGATK